MNIDTITQIEALYTYYGLVLQGVFIKALFGGGTLSALVKLALIAGIMITFWKFGMTGKLTVTIFYLIYVIAVLILVRQVSNPVSIFITSNGTTLEKVVQGVKSGPLSTVTGSAQANSLFLIVANGMIKVRNALINLVGTVMGNNADFTKGPFANMEAMTQAINFKIDQSDINGDVDTLFQQCYHHAAQIYVKNGRTLGPNEMFAGYLGTPDLAENIQSDPVWQEAFNVQVLKPPEGLLPSPFPNFTQGLIGKVLDVKPPPPPPSGKYEKCSEVSKAMGQWIKSYVDQKFPKLIARSKKIMSQDQTDQAMISAALHVAETSFTQGSVAMGAMGMGGPGSLVVSGPNFGGDDITKRIGDWVAGLVSGPAEGAVKAVLAFLFNLIPTIQGWAIMIVYALFPLIVVLSLLPGLHFKILDWLGALWWVHSWPFFWALLDGFYNLTQTMASQNTSFWSDASKIDALYSMSTWVLVFLSAMTPFISYMIFFGSIANLASLRFSFIGSGALMRAAGFAFNAVEAGAAGAAGGV